MTFIQAVLCLWCPLSLCLHNQRVFIIQDQTFYFLHSVHFSSVQFSHSVVFDSLWPRKPQHTRPSCPSPTPGVHPNPCPLSRWCHPSISSSVVPFSSCPQSFPASGSFQMSQLFASGGQSILSYRSPEPPISAYKTKYTALWISTIYTILFGGSNKYCFSLFKSGN